MAPQYNGTSEDEVLVCVVVYYLENVTSLCDNDLIDILCGRAARTR